MQRKPYDGIIYFFNNDFFSKVEQFGFIKVWQISEINIDPSREILEHTQACHEITYIISGKGTFYCGDEKVLLQQGDIHFISKDMRHRIVADSQSNLRFANIGFEFSDEPDQSLTSMRDLFENSASFVLRDKGNVRLSITMLINEMYSKSAYNNLIVEGYLKQILVYVYRLAVAGQTRVLPSSKEDNRYGLSVYAIIRYVDNSSYEFPEISEIAQAMGYSQSYVSHKFKEKMGITLQEYICRKKIEASLDFLKYRKYTVTQIAMMLNYGSVQSFCKAFRKIIGCSPTEYQKAHEQAVSEEDGDFDNETR